MLLHSHTVSVAVPARPRHRRPRLLALLLACLFVLLAACDGGHNQQPSGTPGAAQGPGTAPPGGSRPRLPVTAVPPTPKPSPISAETAQRYMDLWQQKQYAAMYDLLTTAAKQAIAREKFAGRYQAIADEATITGIAPAFTPPADKQADQIPYAVTYTTTLFGEIKQEMTMPLEREGDGWRIDWTPSMIFKDLGRANLVHTFVDVPPRGAILARDGQPLALTASVGVVGTSRAIMNDPTVVKDRAAAISAVAQRLGLNAADIQQKIDDKATPDSYFITIETLPYSFPAAERTALAAVPGVIIHDVSQRVYPFGAMAVHVIGYVARINAEQLAKLRSDGYTEDDVVGASGLEATFEQQLSGKRGARLTIITPDSQVVQELGSRPGAPPADVLTTLDITAQQGAEKALSSGHSTGSLVMLDPADNSVLAMVSLPSYDPNLFVQGLTDQQAAQIFDDKRKALLNRATLATYPPGSTFKVVTTTAGLERGGFTPQSRLPCPPVWFGLGPNLPRANWRPDDLGSLTIVDALMTSCNPVFYQIGFDLDHKDPNILPGITAAFGYGRLTGINGIDEAPGLDPNPDWKQATLHESWFTGDSVNMAIGQGYLLVTPLQVANAYAAITRSGDLRTPLLVRAIQPQVAGAAAQQFQSTPLGQIPMSASTLQVIRDGMTRVVQNPAGTAYQTFAGSHLDAAGKSGTAEDQVLQSHVLFVAYAPRSAPKAVAVVVLDEGQSGSLEAGPIVRSALESYIK